MSSETSDAYLPVAEMSSEASDAYLSVTEMLSETSDTYLPVAEIPSEVSDTYLSVTEMLSEASDSHLSVTEMSSETSDRGHKQKNSRHAAAVRYILPFYWAVGPATLIFPAPAFVMADFFAASAFSALNE